MISLHYGLFWLCGTRSRRILEEMFITDKLLDLKGKIFSRILSSVTSVTMAFVNNVRVAPSDDFCF